MNVYLTKEVKIWATKAGVTDGMFRDAAEEVARVYNNLTSEQIKVAVKAKELHKVKKPG